MPMVPHLFKPWLAQIDTHHLPHCHQLRYYLERHITLDDEDHFPRAAKMLARLCGQHHTHWQQVQQIVIDALNFRIQF